MPNGGIITMIALTALGLLGLIPLQSARVPDISGIWTGQGWGIVILEKHGDGRYSGTYTKETK